MLKWGNENNEHISYVNNDFCVIYFVFNKTGEYQLLSEEDINHE
ncbi:hypothetical protein JOD82_002190 [Paenibacillus sp. 1182]|nr:hypothetical protein [Paenibacillus sp. 1182]